jgi:excisionase family DNA binding protein
VNDAAILTASEAADLLKVSTATITRLCQRGELPHVKVGRQLRFRREWLDTYLNRNLGSDGVTDRVQSAQSALGSARRFPALHGGRKHA